MSQLTNSICENIKTMFDSIHGTIELSQFAIYVIDTKIFQRLRYLKQLGTCNFVYQNAVHTRFEHSIGTYHLAHKLLQQLKSSSTDTCDISVYLSSINELKNYFERKYNNTQYILDDYICELIKIACLCHDLGHGPFSHVYDDVFIPKTKEKNHKYALHETRSCELLRKIIKENPKLNSVIHDDEIQFMCNLINPDKNIHHGFIYQILSNNLNDLDVDKYDYLKRDSTIINIPTSFEFSRLISEALIISNNICYPEHTLPDILNLFMTRHYLHRQVYCHKGVIASQHMMCEIMHCLDDILGLSEYLNDLDKFVVLTDDYIINAITFLTNPSITKEAIFNNENVLKAAKIYTQLFDKHLWYGFVFKHISPTKLNITTNQIVELIDMSIDPSDIIIFEGKIGYVSGNKKNPLDNIYTYNKKNLLKNKKNAKSERCNKMSITTLLPNIHQEYLTFVFYKNKENDLIIEKIKSCIKLII